MPHRKKSGQQADLIEHEVAKRAELRALEQGQDLEARMGEAPPRRLPLKLLVPLLAVILLAITIPVAVSLNNGDRNSTTITERPDPENERSTVDVTAIQTLSSKEVAEAFLQAESWEARRSLVRDLNEVESHLWAYPSEVKAYPIEVIEFRGMGAVSPGGQLRYQRFAARLKDGGMRFLPVVDTALGPKVDYDAFARYSSTSWDELRRGKPADEVRLMAQRGNYYNHAFNDERKWISFKLSCPDWPEPAWGYAPAGSVTAELLMRILSSPQRLTLSLRSTEGSHNDSQFVIEKVVINGWVRTPLDPEETYRRSNPK